MIIKKNNQKLGERNKIKEQVEQPIVDIIPTPEKIKTMSIEELQQDNQQQETVQQEQEQELRFRPHHFHFPFRYRRTAVSLLPSDGLDRVTIGCLYVLIAHVSFLCHCEPLRSEP